MSASSTRHSWSELALRENDGLAVALFWSKATGRVKVTVADVHLDEQFELDVPRAEALAAYYHPFAYAAGLGAVDADIRRGGPSLAPERSTV